MTYLPVSVTEFSLNQHLVLMVGSGLSKGILSVSPDQYFYIFLKLNSWWSSIPNPSPIDNPI